MCTVNLSLEEELLVSLYEVRKGRRLDPEVLVRLEGDSRSGVLQALDVLVVEGVAERGWQARGELVGTPLLG
jgi:hypothetical protein